MKTCYNSKILMNFVNFPCVIIFDPKFPDNPKSYTIAHAH